MILGAPENIGGEPVPKTAQKKPRSCVGRRARGQEFTWDHP